MSHSRRVNDWYQKLEQDVQALMQTSGLSHDECYLLLNPDSESDTVPIIKKHLRTPEQKTYLDQADLSIEDCLNGRFTEEHEAFVTQMFESWNTKLGRKMFGF